MDTETDHHNALTTLANEIQTNTGVLSAVVTDRTIRITSETDATLSINSTAINTSGE
jgi:hypothetical protein